MSGDGILIIININASSITTVCCFSVVLVLCFCTSEIAAVSAS